MNRAKIDEILRPGDRDENERRESKVRTEFWRTAKRAARHVPFMDEVVASYYAALDKRTPMRVRGTLLAALAYFVMPIDMVPADRRRDPKPIQSMNEVVMLGELRSSAHANWRGWRR